MSYECSIITHFICSLRFIYTLSLHEVLSLQFKKAANEKKIFLDIFQPAHDRRLAFIARRMRSEGLITNTFVKPNGFTYVIPKGSTNKVKIYDIDDLAQFADGRDVNEFDESYTDLEEV